MGWRCHQRIDILRVDLNQDEIRAIALKIEAQKDFLFMPLDIDG